MKRYLLALLMSAAAAAQAAPAQPWLINYQGKLLDNNGVPINAATAITFNIYDGAGNVLWGPETPTVSVSNGVFSYQLGTTVALSTNVFVSSGTYLGVKVGGNELLPRQRFVMSPYAVNAAFVSNDAGVQLLAGVAMATFTSAGNLQVPYGVSAATAVLAGKAADPTGAAGMLYYNSGSNKLRLYNGAWVDVATGTVASGLWYSSNTWSAQQTFGNLINISSAIGSGNIAAMTFSGATVTFAGNTTNIGAVTLANSTLTITGADANGYGLEVGYGISAASAVLSLGLTASSGTFTATGGTQFSLVASSGILMSQGTLDVNGGGGIVNTFGIESSTFLFVGRAADPAGNNGMLYYNSTSNKLRLYNGAWVDVATGAVASAWGLLTSSNNWSAQQTFGNLINISSSIGNNNQTAMTLNGADATFSGNVTLSGAGAVLISSGIDAVVNNPGVFFSTVIYATATGSGFYSLVASSGILVNGTGGVTASYFYGNGTPLSGVGALNSTGTWSAQQTFGNLVNISSAIGNGNVPVLTINNNDAVFVADTIMASTLTVAGVDANGYGLKVGYGISAASAVLSLGLTASSGTFTASGGAQYSLVASSGILMNQGTLDVNGGGGIANAFGIESSTFLFVGQAADPAGNGGMLYYNSGTSKLRLYNGAWADVTTGLTGVTFSSGVVAADVTMATANRWYTATATSVTLTAGTYYIVGQMTMGMASGVVDVMYARITDGTNNYASGQCLNPATNPHATTITMTTVVTLGGTTTLALQGTASVANALIKAAMTANGVGNNATQLMAVKLF